MDRHGGEVAGSGRISSALTPVAGGLAAGLAASAAMALTRSTLQVRTVPERILEAVLLVTPPDVFEAGLQRYGFEAKRYALVAASLGMLLVLAALGAWAIGRRWSVRAIVALSLTLWLFVMLIVMPLTGAGPFAIEVINGTRAAVGAHLVVALTYAAALVAAGAWAQRSAQAPPSTQRRFRRRREAAAVFAAGAGTPSRRSALVLSAGAASALLGTFAFVRWGPRTTVTRVVVREPEQPAADIRATAGPSAPTPTANLAARPAAPVAQAPAAAATAAATPAATSTPVAQPPATPTIDPAKEFEPPPVRTLTRDKDGVVLPSGRHPGQLAEPITGTDDFYIVSKNAAGDPFLQLSDWRLRVNGEVQRSIEVDYRSLRNLPPVELNKTLECISNFVTKCELAPFGCDLISTAHWKGARLSDVLTLAGGLKPGVSSLVTMAADDFTAALPIDVALDPDTLIVYEMNGKPLPREHGFPVRVLVPGRYGMKSAKWVVALRFLGREFDDWYAQRSWTRHAVVKTMTRIDTPARDAELPPGKHRIGGIAYSGDRGIQKVEFSANGGDQWQVAELIDQPAGRDVWARWAGEFTMPAAASVTLMARATDGTGELQIEPFSLPQPDGSSGWHSLEVRAKPA